MEKKATIQDLIGLEYAKLGFFREAQDMIAELQASNRELADKQRHIQAILDGITDVMVVLSLDFRLTSVNGVFQEVFHEAEPLGKFCYQVMHQQDQPCAGCPALVARDTDQVSRQLLIFPVNGRNRHFEITASPLRDSDGKPSHILILRRDVTLEKEYQAKYYQAETMATMGVLAAGVAHEINNPLAAISGFAEGLKRRLPKLSTQAEPELVEDFSEYIGIILKECNRCREIVQNLLTFSRQKQNDFSPVDLNSVVTDTLKLLRGHLKGHPQDLIRLELEERLCRISGVESQLKQVLLNLLLNALDATREGGKITVRTVADNGWVVLDVIDTGCGISSEHLSKLFEPFFTTKPVGKGIGIGLSTCYNIVNTHGGEIMACSEEGRGSTFRVKLAVRCSDDRL
ncbi:MAG: two-component system sensor histidine kinase NtrB [Syntrophobacteraceae bacterium]